MNDKPIRILPLSDLHLEFLYLVPNLDEVPDLIVLAGDIGRGTDAISWAEHHFPDTPVAVVLGNHEFYRDVIELTIADCRTTAAQTRHVRFLENDTVTLNLGGRDIRILGTTLWTDFALYGRSRREELMLLAQRNLADFHLIEHRGSRLTPGDTVVFHETAVAWLEESLALAHDGPTMVVTHHAPSPQSIPPQYRDSLLSPAFNSDLEALIERHQPDLWIHGHTHWSTDYRIGRTRVFSNQRGYPGERTGFTMQCISL